jgi:hypothetical protein
MIPSKIPYGDCPPCKGHSSPIKTTEEEPVEIQVLHAIEEVLKFSDPNSVKASIILDRLRSILRLKDLGAAPDMYEALKAIPQMHTLNDLILWMPTIDKALAKAEGGQ